MYDDGTDEIKTILNLWVSFRFPISPHRPPIRRRLCPDRTGLGGSPKNLRITFSFSVSTTNFLQNTSSKKGKKVFFYFLPSPHPHSLVSGRFFFLLRLYSIRLGGEKKEKSPESKWEMGEHNKWISCDVRRKLQSSSPFALVFVKSCSMFPFRMAPTHSLSLSLSSPFAPYPIWWRLMKRQLMWTKNIPFRRLYRTINTHSYARQRTWRQRKSYQNARKFFSLHFQKSESKENFTFVSFASVLCFRSFPLSFLKRKHTRACWQIYFLRFRC